MLFDNLIPAPLLLIKTDFAKIIGNFDTTFRALEDYDYALRLSSLGECVFLNEILLDANYSTNGVSGNPINYLTASCKLIQKYKDDLLKYSALNHRIKTILDDAAKLGLQDKIIKLIELSLS